MMKIKSTLVCGVAVIALTALMAGCNHHPSSNSNSSSSVIHGCSTNPYLMKYGCSITRIQTAAENGNADAQYALGYMYYYGIGTTKDRETAKLWIQRSAAQGQPLAQKAWSLINTGATFTDLHQAAAGYDEGNKVLTDSTDSNNSRSANTIVQQEPADINKLNSTVPTEPITNHLPAYSMPGQSQNGLTSGTSSETGAPPIAENRPTHDSRLSSSAKPVVAMRAPHQESKLLIPSSNVFASPSAQSSSVSNAYTVQLMASDKLSDVKNYIMAHNLGNKARYFETQLDGKPWFMLTYGQYESAAQAQIALQELPSNLQNHHPWVKSIAIVQKEVRLQKVIA